MPLFWNGLDYQTVQINGQYFIGPPSTIPEPSYDYEMFVKHLPRNLFERELIPLFSAAGTVYQIRLLMCFSGLNRGIAYVRYTNEEDFQRALCMFHKLRLEPSFMLHACRSFNLRKLILLNIDQTVEPYAIWRLVHAASGGYCVHIGERKLVPKKKFVIIQFKCHYETAMARRKLMMILPFFGDDCYLKWYHGRQEWRNCVN